MLRNGFLTTWSLPPRKVSYVLQKHPLKRNIPKRSILFNVLPLHLSSFTLISQDAIEWSQHLSPSWMISHKPNHPSPQFRINKMRNDNLPNKSICHFSEISDNNKTHIMYFAENVAENFYIMHFQQNTQYKNFKWQKTEK